MYDVDKLCCLALNPSTRLESLRGIYGHLQRDSSLAKRIWNQRGFIAIVTEVIFSCLHDSIDAQSNNSNINMMIIMAKILQICCKDSSVKNEFLDANLDIFSYGLIPLQDDDLVMEVLKLLCIILSEDTPDRVQKGELLPIILKNCEIKTGNQLLLGCEVLKLILDAGGLSYAVQTKDRFLAINAILDPLLKNSICTKNIELASKVMEVYVRLCKDKNVRINFKDRLSDILENKVSIPFFTSDERLRKTRTQILDELASNNKI